MTRAEFLDAVYTYCQLTTGSVTSWIRTKHHNADEKGVLHSPHLAGLGVDVIYDEDVSAEELDWWATELGLRRIFEKDHDHLQPTNWRAG